MFLYLHHLMQFSSSLLENAVNEFAKLPGIGKKTALRLVLHLLKEETEQVNHFSEVVKVQKQGDFTGSCFAEMPPAKGC